MTAWDLNLRLLLQEALVLAVVLCVQSVQDAAHLLSKGGHGLVRLSSERLEVLRVHFLAEVHVLEGLLELDLSFPIRLKRVVFDSGLGVGHELSLWVEGCLLAWALGLLDVHHLDLIAFEGGSLSLLACEVPLLLEERQSSALLGSWG